MRNRWRHSTLTSATEVRELVSSAMRRTDSIGRRVKSATDATGPRDPMPRLAPVDSQDACRYSTDGMRPRSTSPACSSAEQTDGTS